jgi:serine/threonine-protein kinase
MLLSTPSQRFQSAKEGLDALRAAPTPVVSPAQPQPQPTRKTALQPPAAPQPAPAPLPIQPATPAPITPDRPSFTLLEVLSGAAFTGFEGGLLAIALASLLGTIKSPLFWLILLIVIAGLIFAQTRRWIEKADLLIVAGVSLLLVWLVPFNLFNRIILQPWLNLLGQPILRILLIAGFTCLIAVAATVVFRLIYNLLSRWL